MASSTFRVALTQHEPVYFDLAATVTKACSLIAEAAESGAKLISFPEVWTPGYPAWIWTRPVDFELSVRYIQQSLSLDSPEFRRLQDAARENEIAVWLGFSERSSTAKDSNHGSTSSLYVSQALISSTGELLFHRRKMKPSHMERTVFGDASGECLAPIASITDNESGTSVKVGGLNCWEHIQPLLKQYTFSQGEEIHVAAWPALDETPEGALWSMGTQGSSSSFLSRMPSPAVWDVFLSSYAGAETLSRAYAIEAQCFVLHTVAAFTDKGIEAMGTKGSPVLGAPCTGSSAVFGPDGARLTPEGHPNEELLVVYLDLAQILKSKGFGDASGHYSRPDLLWLGVDRDVKQVVRHKKVDSLL